MLDIKVTTVRKAATSLQDEKMSCRKQRKKAPVLLEYESYLMQLERGKAIEMTLKAGDKFQTIRYRLNNAAKSLGIKNLRIRRGGSKIICYRETRTRVESVADGAVQMPVVRPQTQDSPPQSEPLAQPAPPAVAESSAPAVPAPVVDVEAVLPVDMPAEAAAEAEAPVIVPQPEEGGYFTELNFDEECEMPMVHGIKTCETRVDRYTGEGFEAFGHQYVITSVDQLPLGEVQQKWFKLHGLFSPREFKEVWKQHNKDFDPEQKVWVHQFTRGFTPPPEPDLDDEE